MAYVAISNELRESVRSGIRAMARRELDTIGSVPKLQGTEPFIEKTLWGQHLPLKSQIPGEWKKQCTHVNVRIGFPDGGAWQDSLALNTVAEAPPNYDFYRTPKVQLQHDDPAVKEIVDRISNRRDAEKRWREVETHVLGFLDKCKSLNEGLKLWPDLRMYIDKHYLDRVERKVERSKEASQAAEVLKNIDTSQVVAAAVIARMSTGRNEES